MAEKMLGDHSPANLICRRYGRNVSDSTTLHCRNTGLIADYRTKFTHCSNAMLDRGGDRRQWSAIAHARPRSIPTTLARYCRPAADSAGRAAGRILAPHPDGSGERVPFYRIAMRECPSQLHRDLQPTRLWGFGGSCPGPPSRRAAARRLLVEWVNALPASTFFPSITHLMARRRTSRKSRTVVHLHGAKVPPESDGYPEDWYTPGKSATAFYPNEQDAAMLWYHDHAMGINRLNIYAGLAGAVHHSR